MTSKTHQLKNAMRVYAVELICSMGVSGFQTFKPRVLHTAVSTKVVLQKR